MPTYAYGHIRRLADKLAAAGVAEEVRVQILEGGESLREDASPAAKATWMAGAMRQMDTLLKPAVRRAVREGCACCLGGKRLQISKSIAREHESLDDRIAAANEAKFVFGHSVTRTADDEVEVCFWPRGLEHYGCSCLRTTEVPMSVTYCYCCGGHAKHHLQIALGRKLEVKVRSSPLASRGKRPCTFAFKILD